jgi:hypothetical protein
MKHLAEFLICGTIGTYCVLRFVSLMPRVIAEAQTLVRVATERRQEIEELSDDIDNSKIHDYGW